jgi:hypothetical protein
MLRDLINDLTNESLERPQRILQQLLTSYFEESGTKEDKKAIFDFAERQNLKFMLPEDWFDDEDLLKAEDSGQEGSKEEEVDHETIVFNLAVGTKTAKAIRTLVKFLQDSATKEDVPAIIKLVSGSEELPDSINLSPDAIDIKSFEEDYLRQDMEKALYLEVTDEESIDKLQSLLNFVKESDKIIIDPEDGGNSFDTSSVQDVDFEVKDNRIIVESDNLTLLKDMFTTLAETGNGGHSFEVDTDKGKVFWDGDGSDYLKKVDLVKCADAVVDYANSNYRLASVFNDLFDRNRTLVIKMQEVLAPYGVLVGVLPTGEILLSYDANASEIVDMKLTELDLIKNVSYVQESKGIVQLCISFGIAEPVLSKAKKGTPGYDKWLESYRAKRESKKTETSLEESIKKLLEQRSKEKRNLADELAYMSSRAMHEDALEEMLARPGQAKHSNASFI